MAAIDRGIELSNWSDELRALLRRRICESGGFALIALAAVIAVALATWSVQDPSLSHATDAPVRNLLGTPGAIGADLLMQLFGLASTVLRTAGRSVGLAHRDASSVRSRMDAAGVLARRHRVRRGLRLLPAEERSLAAAHRARRRDRRCRAGAAGVCHGLDVERRDCHRRDRVRTLHAGDDRRRNRLRLSRSRQREARRALGARSGRPPGRRCRARFDLARLAGPRAAEPQGAPRPADQPPLGAARVEARAAPCTDSGGDEARPHRAPAQRRERSGRRIRGRGRGHARARAQGRASEARQALERRLSAARTGASGDAEVVRPLRAEPGIDPGVRAVAGKRAAGLRRARPDHQRASRTGRHALRTGARARHQVVARHRPLRRHRPLDERAVGARRGGVRPQRHRHRAAERQAREGLLPRNAGVRRIHRDAGEAAALPRQDHRRRAGDRRSRAHAAPADRRHHRLRQVGRNQHHDSQPALPAHAGPVPADHGRSQDARALRL